MILNKDYIITLLETMTIGEVENIKNILSTNYGICYGSIKT